MNVTGAGKYSKDTSSFFNARGHDEVQVTYTNGAGHRYTLRQRFPWMLVGVDGDQVFGSLDQGQTSIFRPRTQRRLCQ